VPSLVSSANLFELDIPDVTADDGLLFTSATFPEVSLDIPDFKTFSNGPDAPVNSFGGKPHVNWGPISLSRGVDTSKALWTWMKDVMDKGVTADTVKEVTLKALGADATPLYTWVLHSAVIVQYGYSGANSQSQEVLVNNIQIKYASADLS
jgi:phage tail-like protein